MKLDLEILVLLLNVGLVVAAVWLARILAGSVFANIPRTLIVMAVALTVHSAVDLFVHGPYTFFLYGLTALIAAVAFLFVVYDVYVALKRIATTGGAP